MFPPYGAALAAIVHTGPSAAMNGRTQKIIILCCLGISTAAISSDISGCREYAPFVPQAPVGNPPTIISFTVTTRASAGLALAVFSFAAIGDAGLDSLVLYFGDGTERSWPLPQVTAYSDSIAHGYRFAGVLIATLVAYDSEQRQDTRSLQVSLPVTSAPSSSIRPMVRGRI
jgi:hypothetical protein